MGYIKAYTRESVKDRYPNSMANSVHFAYGSDKDRVIPLNQNYGILYAKAVIRPDNTLEERQIANPLIIRKGEDYLIAAEAVDANGEPLPAPYRIVWRTKDFVNFDEQQNVVSGEFLLNASDLMDLGEQLRNASEFMEIPDALTDAIMERWYPLCGVKTECIPNKVNSIEELEAVKALVTYSDGSVCEKKINWDTSVLNGEKKKSCKIKGRVEQSTTGFPLAVGYADPVIYQWQGFWYFLATNDNLNDIGLFVRKANSVRELFSADTKEYCILDYDIKMGFCQTFWAPEFHEIGGRLYILFAVSKTQWGPQCHMMRLKQNGDITCASDWEEPIRVKRADGTWLAEDGITLDMTYFKTGGKSYLCWSYRYGIGTSKDTGSMLYLATTEEACPFMLTSEPVLLSRPLFGWENNSGTINNEGPYALLLGDKVYLAYSGGDACGYYYAIGYLTASGKENLLDINVWEKLPAPVMHSGSVEGIQGPGHNSFFRDETGTLMIAYHGQERDKYFKRCSAFHRVHISKSGFPLLNVAGSTELPEELLTVEAELYSYLTNK